MNWDFIVLFGTILFFALLHVWSPDGRQWRHDRVGAGKPLDPSPSLDPAVAPSRSQRR
jgi:hypothetical protein